MATWAWRPIPDTGDLSSTIRLLNIRLGKLADTITSLFAAAQAVGTFNNGTTTPSVGGASTWIAQNTVPTSITGFLDGTAGQDLVVWSTTANTTLVHSASFLMKGGVNVVMTATETRRFSTVDGTNWRET